MYIDFDLGLRLLTPLTALVWLAVIGVVVGGVEAKVENLGAVLQPRVLPRDQLISFPIVARDITAGPSAVSGNGTANSTLPNSLKPSAGWSSVSGAKDRQSFYALIKVGDINFRVVLDTGSSDLWILSSECEMDTCKNLPRYPLNYQSPTFQTVNGNVTVFNARYADSSAVSGVVAKEKVELAGLVVANQSFGLISKSNVTLNEQESGFLGLGFPRLSTISTTAVNDSIPFFAHLAQQGSINYPLFGFSLTRNLTGSLSLGAIDASIVTNPQNISWNDVAEFAPFGVGSNTSSYLNWAIPLTSFGVNGTQFDPLPSQANATVNVSLALFDVGTPGFYGPYPDVSRLYDLIDGARLVDAAIGQYVVPCDTNIPLSLTFGSHEYTLLPSDYLIGPASGNPNLCLSWPRALPPSNAGLDWQIGTAFLQTVYTIFSYGINGRESPKIGLYPLGTNVNGTNTTGFSSTLSTTTSFVPQTTIPTTLPNSLISTPTFTTPAFAFNTSVPASIGGIVNSGLATSTYKPILAHAQATTGFNGSAIPTISPSPSATTLTLDGTVTVSTYPVAAITLGVPPGSNSAGISLMSRTRAVFTVQVLVALGLSIITTIW